MSLPVVVNGKLLCCLVPRSGRSVSARRTAAIVERDRLPICVYRGHIGSLGPQVFMTGTAVESYRGEEL
jgi:hypothetical protein